MERKDARYIWYDSKGEGRNLYCMFRKTVNISGKVKSAVLNIFADTAYQLYINGEFIEFGPVRFDPRFPVYDEHDIAKFLKPGKNAIALLVNFIGHKVFRTIPARGGMIAWGQVETEEGTIDLSTRAGSWKAKKCEAYSETAPKLSFALNARDLFNQNLEEEGWKCADFDDSSWPDAMEIEKQDSWGRLEKRGIPFMSGEDVPIYRIAHVLPLEKNEDLYSFSVPLPIAYDTFSDKQEGYSKFFAFETWIYSPVSQQVTAGTLYETLWINGEKAERFQHPYKSLRYNWMLKLNAGWNRLFGTINVYQDILDVYLALPSNKGLVVSADKDQSSPYIFKHTPLLATEVYEKYIKNKPLPYSPDEKLEEIGGWVYSTDKDKAQSPCFESSWDDYGDPMETLTPDSLNGHVFRKSEYPNGFSILVELEYNHLVLQRVVLEGVEGAVVDFIYSDRLQPDGMHIRQQSWVPLGDRVICGRDFLDWMPSHPRGFKYMMITVRNTSKDVKLVSLKLRSAAYPVEEKGSFRCSDPCLTNIWEMGKRTQRTNMEDAYDDCVDRERGMYVLDTVLQYQNNLAAFGDQALMRRCLELYGQSNHHTGMIRAVYPNTGDYILPDFALHAIEGYYIYYMNTGDKELIERCWDSIVINLKRFHRLSELREDLLMNADAPGEKNWESPLTGFLSAGRAEKGGINCMFSCFYLMVLRYAYELARAMGKEEDARDFERRIKILERSIPENFWVEEKGCFKDTLSGEKFSAHTNLYAIRAGVVSEDRMERVKAFLAKELKNVFVNGYDPKDGIIISTNDGLVLFEGLYKAGLYETAENVMRQAWGWFLTQGLKTCPEHFILDNSLCHAWTASPTYYLSRHVLGINYPLAPDLDKVEIEVHASPNITWAEGAFPHPKGVIEVKWHLEGEKRVFDYVRASEGVEVKIVG